MALELSMGSSPAAPSTSAQTSTLSSGAATDTSSAQGGFLDPAFVSQLLGSVDVDQSDPLIQAALAQMGAGGSNAEQKDPGSGDASGGGGESKKRKGDE